MTRDEKIETVKKALVAEVENRLGKTATINHFALNQAAVAAVDALDPPKQIMLGDDYYALLKPGSDEDYTICWTDSRGEMQVAGNLQLCAVEAWKRDAEIADRATELPDPER